MTSQSSFVVFVDNIFPSKIEWDLTNGPLSKLLEILDTQVEGSVQWVLLEISWNILIARPRVRLVCLNR